MLPNDDEEETVMFRGNDDSDQGRRGGGGLSLIPKAMVSQGCRRIRVWRWGGRCRRGLTRVEGRDGRLRQVRLSRTEAAGGGQTKGAGELD